jgi:hypothetical protein
MSEIDEDLKPLPLEEDNRFVYRGKSPIDAIFEMQNLLENLSKKIDIVDFNMKLLNNKIQKMNKINIAKIEQFSGPETKNTNMVSAKPDTIVTPKKIEPGLVIGSIKMYGIIKDRQSNAIKGVDIKIMDKSGGILKTKKTDDTGYWETRMPAGEFIVEYSKERQFKPIQFVCNLAQGMTSFEVK